MTKLEWNSKTERYQASVPGIGLVEVDGQAHAESVWQVKQDECRERGWDYQNLTPAQEEELDRAIAGTLDDLDTAEMWLNCDNVTIDSVDAQEWIAAHPEQEKLQ